MDFATALRRLVNNCNNMNKMCRPSWGKNKGVYLQDYCHTIYFDSDEKGFKLDRHDLFADDYVILSMKKCEQKLLEYKDSPPLV